MSEVENQLTSILLPESTVSVFSNDEDTLASARSLESDWRFARVSMQVQNGDIESATQLYASQPSPDLLIIQTETIDEAFTAKLEALAGNCDEGTAAVIIGPVNDVYLYRRMIDMGISDYLVKPVAADVMADVMARSLIERLGVTGSRLIAYVGAKGGVGTSILAQACAAGIADILDQKTILLDACGGWSTLGVGLGFEPATTLAEAVKAAVNNAEDNLNRMLHKVSDKLSVLASGGDVMLESTVSAEQFEVLVNMLMVKYPVVVIDLSQAPENLKKVVLSKSNQIHTVSTPTLTSLRQGRSLVQEIKEIRGGSVADIELIVNMQGLSPKHEVGTNDIEQAMDLKVSSIIDFDPVLFQGNESASKRLTLDPQGREVVDSSLMTIVQKVLDVEVGGDEDKVSKDKAGFLGGLLKKIGS